MQNIEVFDNKIHRIFYFIISRRIDVLLISKGNGIVDVARSSRGKSVIRKTGRVTARHLMNFSDPFGRTAN